MTDTTIKVSQGNRKKLMRIKIDTELTSVDEVITMLLKRWLR